MSFDLCYMQFVYIFFFRALRFQLERKDREMKILVSRNSFFPVSFLVLPLNCYSYILLSVRWLRRVISLRSVFPLKYFTLYVSALNVNA